MTELAWKLKSIEQFSEFEIAILARLNALSEISTIRSYNSIPCHVIIDYDLSNGYGRTQHVGQSVYTHRLAASLFFDFPLGSDLDICHHCDTRNCWEPSHLFPGTRSDNMKDCYAKGRSKNTFGQQKLAKTHCPQGHPYSGINLILTNKGDRKCKTCQYEYVRNWNLKRKGLINA